MLDIVDVGKKDPAVGVCRVGDVIKFGNAEGGWTFESKFPPILGTLATETLGDGSKDVDEDILLRDSKENGS